MSIPRRWLALAATATLALLFGAPSSRAQLVDGLMTPADLFLGEIDAVDDVDLVQLDTVAGSSLIVTVVAGKGSSLVPSVRLLDASDESVLAEAAGSGKKVTLKTSAVATTGSYWLRVTGTLGTTGSYALRFKEKLGKSAKKLLVDATVTGGDSLEVAFDAAAGFELSGVVQRRNGKSPADPAEPTLADPAESPVLLDESQLKPSKKGDRFALKRVPLDATGTWLLAALNEGDTGELRAKLALRRGKAGKRVLEELPVGDTGAPTLAGLVLAGGSGAPLAGVLVTLRSLEDGFDEDDAITVATDADGAFVVQDPLTGPVCVHLDGSTQTSDGHTYQALNLLLEVALDGPSELPRPAVLPRLSDPDAASQLGLTLGAGGATTQAVSVTSPTLPLALSSPPGTLVFLDGEPATGSIDLAATPVAPSELPAPLVDGDGLELDAAALASVEPALAQFDAGGTAEGALPRGLDLTLPNDRALDPGTLLDIWAYDGDSGSWIDRSAQTGEQGVVSGDGLSISASDVVLTGGFHAAVVPVDPTCATTLTGHVQDAITGAPLIDVAVVGSLGQMAVSDVNGDFSMPLVPAFDPASLPACDPIALTLAFHAPVASGAVGDSLVVSAGAIVHGGSTDVGTVELLRPGVGLLVGQVIDNGFPVAGGSVTLSGPSGSSEGLTDDDGRFFLSGLTPGSYVGAFTFVGAEEPTEVAFSIVAHAIATIAIQRADGQGDHDVSVRVVSLPDSPLVAPAALHGVKVVLVGSDPFSSQGLTATTNAQGRAQFQSVDPPYTVSAQLKLTRADGQTVRATTSVVGITPADDTLGIPITVVTGAPDVEPDALLEGSVAHIPEATFEVETSYEVLAVSADPAFPYETSVEADFDGLWSLDVPAGHGWHVVLRETTIEYGDFDDLVYQSGAAFALSVADPGVGGTTTVDFDLDASDFVPFDQAVSLSYQGLPAPVALDLLALSFTISDGASQVDALPLLSRLDEVYGDDEYAPPTSLTLPDADHPALAGFRQALTLQHATDDESPRGAGCEQAYDGGTTSVAFALPGVPVLSNPSFDESFEVSDLDGLTLQWFDQTDSADRGWVSITLEAGDLFPVLGVDRSRWELIVPLGAGTSGLPPTPKPALVDGLWKATLRVLTATGTPFDFETAFGDTVEQVLGALPGAAQTLCRGEVVHPFEIVPD